MLLFDLFFPKFCKSDSRGTDISKYFREFIGLRDNESRLYNLFVTVDSGLLHMFKRHAIIADSVKYHIFYKNSTVAILCKRLLNLHAVSIYGF